MEGKTMTDPISKLTRISKILEDRFFFEDSLVLKDQLAHLKRQRETEDALSKVSGIVNKAVLKELVALNIRPETLSALVLVPIIEVAWADGTIAGQERLAILEGAKKNGFGEDNQILKEWLLRKPDAPLMDAWRAYMSGLCEIIGKECLATLKADILAHARMVAEASGGFLGLTNPISAKEKAVLDSIEAFFRESRPCRP
jgi:hypothetical protein